MEEVGVHAMAEEAVGDDTESDSGDLHMTPAAGGVVSENYYTTLEGGAQEAWTKDSTGGPSEAPNIKSPRKPRQEGPRGRQNRAEGAGRQTSGRRGVAAVKGRRKMDSGTTENTAGTGEDIGQTSARRGRATRRREVEYMVRIRPKLEALMGNVEAMLLATAEQQQDIAEQEQ
jgi:hypothetical protein